MMKKGKKIMNLDDDNNDVVEKKKEKKIKESKLEKVEDLDDDDDNDVVEKKKKTAKNTELTKTKISSKLDKKKVFILEKLEKPKKIKDDKVRVLAIGDLHIQPSNIQDVNIFLTKLNIHLSKNYYDFIVCLGDTLHKHEEIDSTCLGKATEYFELLRYYADVKILVGNHDYISNQQFLTNKHWLNPFKMASVNKEGLNSIRIIDTVICEEYNEKKFVFIPYVTDGMFKTALESILGFNYFSDIIDRNIPGTIPSCIFGHQLLDGAKMGAIVAKDTERWDLPIQIFSGHIHDRQMVKIPVKTLENRYYSQNIYYTGSSLQSGFGENGDKTIAEIIVNHRPEEIGEDEDDNNDEKEFIINEVDLDLPKRKIVRCSIENVKKTISKLPLGKIKDKSLKVKIYVTDSIENYKAFVLSSFYKEQIALGIKFTIKKDIKDLEYKDLLLENDEKGCCDINVEKKESKRNFSKTNITNFFSLLRENLEKEGDEKLEHLFKELVAEIRPMNDEEVED